MVLSMIVKKSADSYLDHIEGRYDAQERSRAKSVRGSMRAVLMLALIAVVDAPVLHDVMWTH